MNSLHVEIVPSLLAANFAALGEEFRSVEQAGARMLHVDVMDGHFVPNISVGVPVVASLRKATALLLDVHLMIQNPGQYVDAFAEAGADMISVHQEATPHVNRLLVAIRERGCKAGVVINPGTALEAIGAVLGDADYVLVMSVNPGFGGQKFIPGTLERLRQLAAWRAREGHAFRIEVDGGVGPENAGEIARAGADILVAGTSIFHAADPAEAFRQMRQLANEAVTQKV